MKWAHLRSVFALACVVGSTSGFPGENAPGLKRAVDPSVKFDITSGPQTQVTTSDKDAPSVVFTTEGGTPYSQPYDYQRIGSDGMFLSILSRYSPNRSSN